ncbi:MAG: trigger factor, partial [Oscillospiraceae bacterium]
MSLINCEKVDTNKVTLEFSVDSDTFGKAIDQAYRKMVKTINVQGFRKGKAPKTMIEKMYGEDVFFDEAFNIVYPAAYEQAFTEAGVEPVAYATAANAKSASKADGVIFTTTVTVKPEVTMGEYKGLEVTKMPTEITEDDVAKELATLQQSFARTKTVEGRATQTGDIVSIDFEGFVDGVAFEGGK